MRPQSRTVEQELARIGTDEHGVVTRVELLAAGISAAGIQRRVRKGTLLPEYRGVYRVGHRAPSLEARYLSAVRACGDGAVLYRLAAGYFLGLIKGAPPAPEVLGLTERRIEGILTRRARKIDRREVTIVRGIPVTTVPRTLADLASVLVLDDLARACHEAGVRYRTTPRHVDSVLARRPRVSGARNLRRVLHGDAPVVLSELERLFLALLREHGLPLPVTNRLTGAFYVDCRWPDHSVTVELLSYGFHNSRHSWEKDHRRPRDARRRGDRFRTYTWTDVVEDPRDMLRELHELLVPTSPA